MQTLPPAVETRKDLKPSKALSIGLNPPKSFAGRKVGALVTDGVDSKLLDALKQELEAEGAMLELIAPTGAGLIQVTAHTYQRMKKSAAARPCCMTPLPSFHPKMASTHC